MARYFIEKPVVTLLMKLFLMVVLTYKESLAVSPYEHRRFSKVTQCPGQVISPAARYQSVTTRSVLECVSLCRPDTACASIVFDVVNNTCHLADTRISENCSNTVSGCDACKYYEKPPDVVCENGGTRSADGQSCFCPNGYYGYNCNITFAGCDEYVKKRLPAEHFKEVVFISLQGVVSPFPVLCVYVPKSDEIKTHIALRGDKTANFNLTWKDYKDGFGKPKSDIFWVGLENLHHLTSIRNYQLRFRVNDFSNTKYYQFYDNFTLYDEANGYAFSLNALPVHSLGDCLSGLQGASFSTYDMDNDGSTTRNCAMEHGAGWWFKGDNCSSCNPFGPFLSPFNGTRKGEPGEAFWTENLGDIIPVKVVLFLLAKP